MIFAGVVYTELKFLLFKCPCTYCYPALRSDVMPFGWLSSVCSFHIFYIPSLLVSCN